MIRDLGVRGFIRFVRETISGPWLDAERLQGHLPAPLFNFVCYKYPGRDKKPQYPLTMIMGKQWYAQLKIIMARIKENDCPKWVLP